MSYQGKKFVCIETKMVRDESIWWEDVYKEVGVFCLTKGYKKYLKEKREREQLEELATMKAKLDYQYKTYGEVDEIDYQEYLAKLKSYNK